MRGSVVDCIVVNIDFFGAHFHQWNRFDRLYRCNYWILLLTVVILQKCRLHKKQKVNAILRQESRNMRLNVKLFLSVYGMQLWNWLQWVNIILAVI